jgi:ABC-type molybdate transport system permease subunit
MRTASALAPVSIQKGLITAKVVYFDTSLGELGVTLTLLPPDTLGTKQGVKLLDTI